MEKNKKKIASSLSLLAMTRLTILLCTILFVFAILSSTVYSEESGKEESQPSYNVGYQVLDFKYKKDGKELTAAVWYPTSVEPKKHTYGGSTIGSVAADAKILEKGGPYPLLIFSHGYSGGGISSVFFTERLAARGWIVAAPDHHDRHSAIRIRTGQKRVADRKEFFQYAQGIASSSPEDKGKYLYRLDEMKLALDSMVDHPLFSKIIDTERIAVGGHSFGGYTALGLCGTIEERHDTRIKGVLLFSTGAGGYLFSEKELQKVKMPSLLFIGEREKGQSRGIKTMSELSNKIYRSMSSPKYFLEVKGANHFSFNNHFINENWTGLLSGTEEQFEVIRKYSIAFLEKHVAGREHLDQVLKQKDPMITQFQKEEK